MSSGANTISESPPSARSARAASSAESCCKAATASRPRFGSRAVR
jgi:hypothetical protein